MPSKTKDLMNAVKTLELSRRFFFFSFFYLWLNFIVAQTGKQIVLGTKNEEKRKSLFFTT